MAAVNPSPSQYEQIANELRQRIVDGVYPPGSVLPSEPQLAEEFGLSRVTINQAIRLLRADGLVRVRRGSATLVRGLPKIRRDAQKRYAARDAGTGAADVELRELGAEPRVEFGEVGQTSAPAEVALALDIPKGAAVLVRRRVVFANDEPTQIADSYYPWDLVKNSALSQPNATPSGGSLAQLAQMGYPVVRFTEDVDVRLPTEAERRTLEIDARQPVFQITHIAWTAEATPVEVAIHVMPGSLWRLHYGWNDGAP